ncbi:MAG: iron hydrogenase small subunit [Bacteroidales bacterium]|nr:iron hydrogenase small subunit [Bacteroidales bacterium]
MENMINLTIDDIKVQVPKGTTILKAAKSIGIDIPTLCHYELKGQGVENRPGSCRVCMVEVEGKGNLAAACATNVSEGMVVKTHTLRVIMARRTVVDLMLSDHPADCLVCPQSGKCELQKLAVDLGLREVTYSGEKSVYKVDVSPAIIRDVNKCVMCRRCETVCNSLQTVGALSAINRGFPAVVGTAFEQKLSDSTCVMCGQCVQACPVGALSEVDNTRQVMRAISDPKKTVIVQTAPAVRVAIGEEFGMEPGSRVTGKMVTALRMLGFDYVFDTDFAADLTIMEEGTEMLQRLDKYLKGDKDVRLPIMTSCCPGWVNFFETYYPDMLDVPSTAKSPMQMFGAIAKTYWAEKLGIKREDLVVVSIMPCVAKKYECQREEFKTDGNPDVDYSLTTRELADMIKLLSINFADLKEEEFDRPLGESTGAAVIFGATGGVIEAATRTAYELFTKKELGKVDFTELRGLDGVREATVDFNGTPIHIGIAHGLGNARKLLDRVRNGETMFHAIEIMACPGGCVGGAGQPYHHGDFSKVEKRLNAIYEEDRNKPLRKSHENPYIKQLYEEFLGEPCGEKSHKLLHTHYFDKSAKVEEVDD